MLSPLFDRPEMAARILYGMRIEKIIMGATYSHDTFPSSCSSNTEMVLCPPSSTTNLTGSPRLNAVITRYAVTILSSYSEMTRSVEPNSHLVTMLTLIPWKLADLTSR